MRTPSILIGGLTGLFLLSSCTTVKRFQSASYKGEADRLVEIELFGTALEESGHPLPGKSLWDLSAGAQEEMIQVLHERFPENRDFMSVLSREYLPGAASGHQDLTRHDLHMVFTIQKAMDQSALGKSAYPYSPADRIESLCFRLQLPEELPLTFTNWNRFETEYGEIEIADMSFNRSLDLEGSLSGEVLESKAGSQTSRKEDQVVRSRYMLFNGSLSEKRMEIREEGSRETDLAGNVSADVALVFEPMVEKICRPVLTEGPGGSLGISKLGFVDVRVPRMENIPEQITAHLELEYVYRHVEKGWKTFHEWDDRVAWYKGQDSQEVLLFERADFVPPFCCIGTEEASIRKSLRVRLATGAEYELKFPGYAEASRFFDWLALLAGKDAAGDEAIRIGGATLLFGDAAFTRQVLRSTAGMKVMPLY